MGASTCRSRCAEQSKASECTRVTRCKHAYVYAPEDMGCLNQGSQLPLPSLGNLLGGRKAWNRTLLMASSECSKWWLCCCQRCHSTPICYGRTSRTSLDPCLLLLQLRLLTLRMLLPLLSFLPLLLLLLGMRSLPPILQGAPLPRGQPDPALQHWSTPCCGSCACFTKAVASWSASASAMPCSHTTLCCGHTVLLTQHVSGCGGLVGRPSWEYCSALQDADL